MIAAGGASDPSRLTELCGQFEAVLLRGLLPHGMFRASARLFDDESGQSGDATTSADAAPEDADASVLEAMFAQSFAAALERAGGLGLARVMARTIDGDRS